jgi:uncharacterized protein (DUF1810 family)
MIAFRRRRERSSDVNDPHDLQRFVDAQDAVYDRVLAELRAGRKTSHWMWFVFPQIAGLGNSSMAQRFAIASLEEARAYLAHEVLGPRLRECTQLLMNIRGETIGRILGYPDDLKFRSCMTLFAKVAGSPEPFDDALEKFFDGERDPKTLERLGAMSAG